MTDHTRILGPDTQQRIDRSEMCDDPEDSLWVLEDRRKGLCREFSSEPLLLTFAIVSFLSILGSRLYHTSHTTYHPLTITDHLSRPPIVVTATIQVVHRRCIWLRELTGEVRVEKLSNREISIVLMSMQLDIFTPPCIQ